MRVAFILHRPLRVLAIASSAVVYLNHAGTSFPKPEPVHEAIAGALRADPGLYSELYEAAFKEISLEWGAQEHRLLLTSGCTAALGLVLGDLPWRQGEILLTSAWEHHALDRQAQSLELGRGVIRHVVPPTAESPVDLESLRGRLGKGGVRAVALTAASNITGELLPLKEISQLTREAGALLIVDAAQTFGTRHFAEAVAAADVVVAAGHKSALGPQGIGLLSARAEVEFSCPGAICEVGETSCATFFGFCDVGSTPLAGACGLAAGLAWSRETREHAEKDREAWAQRLRMQLHEREDVTLLGDLHGRALPILSFVPLKLPLGQTAEHFSRFGVQLRVGTHCAPLALRTLGHEGGCARVSFGPFNKKEDGEKVLAALDEL